MHLLQIEWGVFQHEVEILVAGLPCTIHEPRFNNHIRFVPPKKEKVQESEFPRCHAGPDTYTVTVG